LQFLDIVCNFTVMNDNYKYAEVALPVPIDHTFTYIVPDELAYDKVIGMRVLVPFGKRKLTGIVVNFKERTEIEELKSIEDILDEKPIISTEQLNLAKWISEYYICPLGEVLRAMVPLGVNIESTIKISLNICKEEAVEQSQSLRSENIKRILTTLLQKEFVIQENLRKKKEITNLSYTLLKLEQMGLIKRDLILQSPKVKPKFEKWVRFAADISQIKKELSDFETKAPRQAECLKLMLSKKEMSKMNLLKKYKVSTSTINSLIEKKMIIQYEKEIIRDYYAHYQFKSTKPITLNHSQAKAVDTIEKSIANQQYDAFLLHGVTGSGKTQVYIETLKQAIEKGRTAIVLVPEISLTPQTVSRFTANFPNLVAVLHSRMSPGERYDSWRKLKDGSLKIAIGPRSAIFAPLNNIGLIIVDEEHESSYKQHDMHPLYNARDVALVRGKLNNAVVILGSATPSIESFYNAKSGKYKLLNLPNRIDNIPLPEVAIIDMLQQKTKSRHDEILSKPLFKKITEKLENKEQIILLQNRRGFSTFIKCKECGYIEKCVNCDITLTYHITTHRLRCHYCNYIKKAPDICPKCSSSDIIFRGIGTQQVESELQKTFPDSRIVRMDLDTTAQKMSHDRILRDFEQRKYDILLGTQMVAKGLDFEDVTLVGVISADTGLTLPEFRATEKTFQLLTQVAGRAGRKNKVGEVIIQTYSPTNIGLLCAKTHDFIKFYLYEIQQRKELNYPPFSRLIQILVKGEKEEEVTTVIQQIKLLLQKEKQKFQLLGPVPAPLSKLKKYYRWHIILKIDKRRDMSGKLMNKSLLQIKLKIQKMIKKDTVRVMFNVDPASLL